LNGALDASIDLADGHADISASDIRIPGRGPDLALNHIWDSIRAQVGITTVAGQGWLTNLSSSMGGVLTATVSYTAGDGTVWPFTYSGTLTPTAGLYTAYRAPAGQPWQLTASAGGYTLTNFLSGAVTRFDATGRYLSDTDSYGNSDTLSAPSGGVQTWSNSGGRAVRISAYGSGLVSDARSPLWQSSGGAQGQFVTYGYNGSAQLTQMTWGAGTTDALTATFGYSGTQLVTVTTPYTGATRPWAIGYDAFGRVSSLTSPVSGTAGQIGYTPAYTTQITYGATQTQVVAGYGASGALTTTYTLDGQGEPITTTDGLRHSTGVTYDANHDVLSSQDANGNVTTSKYQYIGPNGYSGAIGVSGTVGQLVEEDQPAIQAYSPVNGVLVSPVITHTYDPSTHDLVATGKPEGGLTRYSYDGHHSVVTTTEQTTPNTCATTCPVTWRGSIDGYDQYGERSSSTDGRGVGVDQNGAATLTSQANAYTSHQGYDTQGDLVAVGTPPITTTLNAITTTAPVTTTYGYDGDGEQTAVTSANGNTIQDAYDHLGRHVRTTLPPVAVYPTGVITTLAGLAVGCPQQTDAVGDGCPALLAGVDGPGGVVSDAAGNLYLADSNDERIRKIDARTGLISTVAGNGTQGYGGDGGPAAQAVLNISNNEGALALDGVGNLYLADTQNGRIREVIAATGIITTVAGNGAYAYGGDGGAATAASLAWPRGVALDAGGNLYIADTDNSRIRKVDGRTRVITTVAGTGITGYGGDGGAATAAQLGQPTGVALDAGGNLYIADQDNNRVRKVTASTGAISTIAGMGIRGYGGDGGPATAARFNLIYGGGVALDAVGNLYVADTQNSRVREIVAATGLITTVAGTGLSGFNGDGLAATQAQLAYPVAVGVDGRGNLLIGDTYNGRVREVPNVVVTPTETTGYDGEGNTVRQTDANGHTTTSNYDPLGRMVS